MSKNLNGFVWPLSEVLAIIKQKSEGMVVYIIVSETIENVAFRQSPKSKLQVDQLQ